MVFNDTTNSLGIVQDIRFNTGSNEISYPTADITRDCNSALDIVEGKILASDGRWQYDDTNYTDAPIGKTGLTENVQRYALSLEHMIITRIEALDPNSNPILLKPLDQNDMDVSTSAFLNTAGTPQYYDKIGNFIDLYPKPNYTLAAALRVFFKRKPSYFAADDTTKEPGFANIYHRLISLYPSYWYCSRNGMPQAERLFREIQILEQGLEEHYGRRDKDEALRMTAYIDNNQGK